MTLAVLRPADRPFLGVLLMLGFCVLAPVADAFAKDLGGRVGLVHILALRFAVQTVLLAPLALGLGLPLLLRGRTLALTALRGALHLAGIAFMVLALRHMPLADAVAIAFVMPFLMLLLGRFVLGETVGRRRLIACGVGFLGTLLVVQPSFVAVGAAALLPLGVALIFALFMLVTRMVARDADPLAIQTVSGVFALLLIAPPLIFADAERWPDLAFGTLPVSDWIRLGLMGIVGTAAHLLMTWSLRLAPSATLAPLQYVELPFATLVGFLAFGDLPNGLAALGILVTMGAGLAVLRAERRAAG